MCKKKQETAKSLLAVVISGDACCQHRGDRQKNLIQRLHPHIKHVSTLMSSPSFQECRNCACSALRRVTRAVTQHYERHFRGTGLRVTQFTILATLAQTGPLSISELSAKLGLERTTLSRNLRLIENKGWVSALAHDDQRVRKMTLTAKGRKKAANALTVWGRADASAETVLRRFGLQSRPMLRTK
jgi:DNA-binding MarR family transcriptional regulator